MKIIRLSTFLDYGGIESKMIKLSKWSDENEWVFVALNKGGFAERQIQQNNKRVTCLYLDYKIPSVKTIFQLYQFLKKEKPDILHTSGAEANFFGFFAGKLAGVKNIIVEEIGIPKHSFFAKFIFKFIFRNSNKTIGESKAVIQFISNNYNVNNDDLAIVSNFGLFDYDFSNILRVKDVNFFNILMIGRLENVKNIEGVLNVFSKLINENLKVNLTILGTGNLENQLKKNVNELGIKNNVNFVGFVNDPYPFLMNSDLYVLNSFTEGFSNSLIEAMYSKTPSLSTISGAAPEIINDNEDGFLIPVDDEIALYEKIKYIMLMDRDKLESIGLKGHQKIIEGFTLAKYVENLIKIYSN